MKKIVTSILLCLALVCCLSAEKSGIGMYAKLEAGYSFWAPDINDVYCESNCFEVTPTFGLFPIKGNRNFALETAVDLNFGGKDELKTTVIAPKVMALFYIPLGTIFNKGSVLEKLLPYAGIGFSVPIQKVEYKAWDESSVTFKLDMQIGAMFKINEKIAVCADLNSGLLKPWTWSVKAGAMYTFK